MLSGVLFDLDGTLLDIDLDSFLRDYFAALGPVVAEALGLDPHDPAGLAAVVSGTGAMMLPHPGTSNRDAFNAEFERSTGADLRRSEYASVFERFYAEVFPTLREDMGPHQGAGDAVSMALSMGHKVAIATNPIFPMSAVRERMRWAGIDRLDVHVVTAYENMHATKPHGAYYLETATMLGVDPSECLMVGDDRSLDMSAADVGMRTFYVGDGPLPACDWSGSLEDLAHLLTRLGE